MCLFGSLEVFVCEI